MPGVTGAALGENAVPDEMMDDGAAIVVESVLITASLPVSDPALDAPPVATDTSTGTTTQEPAPTENSGSNQIFLPIITNLAGAALGSPSGLALLVLAIVVMGGLVWQRRLRKR